MTVERYQEWPRQLLMALVRGYRLLLKPWLGNSCRFEPTCSAYALLALQQHGAWRGAALGGWRVLRCHPGCTGGHDPVPVYFAGSIVNPASLSPTDAAGPIGGDISPRTGTGDQPDLSVSTRTRS